MLPVRRSVLALCLALTSLPHAAEAAFETWRFPGPPVPFRLADVTFSRTDRREAVNAAVRDMVLRQLRDSGVFRDKATAGVTVDLREVESASTVDPDGVGIGRAAILYRVTDPAGRVLFNDRIATSARVTVRDSLPLRQSTQRAARYRAFSTNLDAFAHLLWAEVKADHAAADRPLVADVALDSPLETPARTADFAARLKTTLDILLPGPAQAKQPVLSLRVAALSFRETSPAWSEAAQAEVEMSLTLVLPGGAGVWNDTVKGRGEANRHTALLAGISPVDAAIAAAAQAAMARVVPALRAAAAEATALHSTAQNHKLPFRLNAIDGAPSPALARLREWNSDGAPLATVWSAGGKPITIRLEALATQIRQTKAGQGSADVAATYLVSEADGRPLLSTRQEAQAPFAAADTAPGTPPGEDAMRVALCATWAGMLDSIVAWNAHP
ncbi:hypothetical protein [Oleispirillum naphthae]|uniref:hypothetical protein n=1 Tax=Oleispirillum naphthae TaxID=2838853 RepID=UPI0030826220